jgi:hypothetical protein
MNSLPDSRRPHISAPGTPQIANSGSQCRTSTRSTSECLPNPPVDIRSPLHLPALVIVHTRSSSH